MDTFATPLLTPAGLSSDSVADWTTIHLSRRKRQDCDPPHHTPKEPPRQMALRQQQPVIAGVFHQPSIRLERRQRRFFHELPSTPTSGWLPPPLTAARALHYAVISPPGGTSHEKRDRHDTDGRQNRQLTIEVEDRRTSHLRRSRNYRSLPVGRIVGISDKWSGKLPSSRATLRSPSPLRTVHDTFVSHGSSIQ